ncbi:protein lunapark [Favolaschia claudopus]|uniref:Endoplasmic reticulum junction formation protein lunapark n=1 Tax=Favolaschia claudopus TaxID=2862362 RepID=A0AAW0E185_9AGAR
MSFLWRLFRSDKPPDDESVLATLARDIHRRQTLLSEIRARERTTTALVTLYTIAAWLVYVAVWYFGFVTTVGRNGKGRGAAVERAVRALPVIVGPIFILFIRRIVQIWYARKGNAEEKTLQTLLKAQRAKVEEIKKKTNFYETRELLSRYDRDGGSAAPPNGAGGGPGSVSSPNTPQRGPNTGLQGKGSATEKRGAPVQGQGTPRPSALGVSIGPNAPRPPQPQPAPRGRGWFDALADVLVGPDDTPQVLQQQQQQLRQQLEQEKAKQKYALICGKCFAHNGLVGEVEWANVREYACPKCGHFNPPARSRGLASPNASSGGPNSRFPSSPLSPSPLSAMSVAPRPIVSEAAATRRSGSGGVQRRSAQAESDGDEEEEEDMEVDS